MGHPIRALVCALGLAWLAACHARPVSVHDPALAKEGNTFYLFSTGPGVTFYSSADMHNWKPEGRVFKDDPVWARQAAPTFDGHVWAPDIHAHGGKFYLYYSVSGFGLNTSGIGVTTNATLDPRAPNYRWEDQGMLLQSVPGRDNWNAIDPNAVDDAEGTPWMVFGSFWSGIKLVRLDAGRARLAEPQEWHALASRARVPGTPDAQPGSAEIEGGGSLVIAGNARWQGVGHNSAYTIDGQDLMVLHAYETADDYLQKLKILNITWDRDGWPTVDPQDLDHYQSKQL